MPKNVCTVYMNFIRSQAPKKGECTHEIVNCIECIFATSQMTIIWGKK